MKGKLEDAKELLRVQGTDGNWDHDNYMTGMYNGMELIIATLEDREPVHKDTVEEKLPHFNKYQKDDCRLKNNEVNLCDSCINELPCVELDCECIFGDGVGNDNICACNRYSPNFEVNTSISKAIDILTKALKEDSGYYIGWQANIAMAFIDNSTEEMRENYEELHEIANRSAKHFLDLLIKQ